MECTNGVLRTEDGFIMFKTRDRKIVEKPIDNVKILQSPLGKYIKFGTKDFSGAWAGFNESGLAIVSSTLHVNEEEQGVLLPDEYIVIEEVLRDHSSAIKASEYVVERFHELFDEKKVGANILLSDKQNAMALEWGSGTYSKEILGEQRYLLRTNHGVLLTSVNCEPSFNNSSYVRFKTAKEILDRSRVLGDIVSLTKSHFNGPSGNSICRHGESIRTFSAVIFELAELRAHCILNANPCEKDYKELVM